MRYEIRKLPNEPIIIAGLNADFSISEDGAACAEEIIEFLDRQRERVFLIVNILHLAFSFEDILGGSSLATRQIELFKHPNMREGIVITQSRMVELASRGLSSEVFGRIKLRSFKTLDEALSYARDAALY